MSVVRSLSLLLTAALLAAQSPAENPGDRLRSLVRTDWEKGIVPADRWPDLSQDALSKFEVQDRATLGNLRAISRNNLNLEDRTLYDLFARELGKRLDGFRLRIYLTPFWLDFRFNIPSPASPSPLFPPAMLGHAIESLTAAIPPGGSQERLRKLEDFPMYEAGVLRLLKEGKNAGMVPSCGIANQIVAGVAAVQAAFGLPFSRPFASIQGRATAEREQIREKAQSLIRDAVLPALRQFEEEVRGNCTEAGSLAAWPNGDEIYRALASDTVGTRLDPQQTHEFGLREVERIRGAMVPVLAAMGFQGGVDNFPFADRTDARLYFTKEDELLAAYRTAAERIQSAASRVIPIVDVPAVIKIESMRSPDTAGVYERTRRVVRVDVSRLDLRPRFEVIPVMLHEGIPGHYLQDSVARSSPAQDDAISKYTAVMRQSAGFPEGWGLYAETLGGEMGLYSDPLDKFGQLSMELLRAVRVVMDTGIHQQRWSLTKAKEYFMAQTGRPQAMAEAEVSRTIHPGGQLAYKVGEQRIRRMRDRAAQKLGAEFDIRGFHQTILRWGPLPLDVLDAKLTDCLDDSACSANLKLHP